MWNTTGHRGDPLEDLIVLTNEYYKKNGYGRVDKVATPIKVVDINERGVITKGYFDKKSTIDFFGVVQGVAIAFDAKETNLKSLPLSNIHDHQVDYMKDIKDQGGLSFIIVHFKFCDEYYLIGYELIKSYVDGSKMGERKSIPYKDMKKENKINKITNSGILNYLPNLNVYIKERDNGRL